MKPIRLAIVRQKYRPDGGAERFISRALEALDQQAMDLNVITRQWQGERQANWHLHLCDPVKWGRISRERGFANAARTLWQRENFDIVQSHERIAGCDIYRAGDGVHQRWLELRSRLLPTWRQKLLMNNRYHRYVMGAERAMYQAPELKAVICNAQMVKQEIIERFGVASDKIHVIYNAINTTQFIPADEADRLLLRQKLGLPSNATLLIYVGSGFERKGLAAAIRAIADTNRYLVVVGKDKAEKQYRALATELGCSDRVFFAGMQSDTRPWYQVADGLLLPTLYDPFPNVILEAMACGLPVITSTTCGGSEFIRPGENGYVCDALDIAALRDAVMALPEHAIGSSMAGHARERVMGSSPQRLSQQLIALYQQILE
ncbi:UDP-glucose:(heptosyl)LPS alpha-1,3-glucosyltransferase [Erwinia toletana]|uniref:UDP-glucose:(Heptosyl)LPS alpha-1,3-glucosyltransferase n=1 Tax=Winslowiella toletana TaxID=92490 RepID=A0ABS4P8Y2_9GAMM|nr:glycosyltransferase family 4 protein [Winslowiella toletana]MBP2169114.1 UDP-glucose:(heptosyl)LPS alpha-1,3-glucosyltransferase [Winslowiella toletana]